MEIIPWGKFGWVLDLRKSRNCFLFSPEDIEEVTGIITMLSGFADLGCLLREDCQRGGSEVLDRNGLWVNPVRLGFCKTNAGADHIPFVSLLPFHMMELQCTEFSSLLLISGKLLGILFACHFSIPYSKLADWTYWICMMLKIDSLKHMETLIFVNVFLGRLAWKANRFLY